MSDFQKLQNEAVAPVPSMLAEPKTLDIIHTGGVEKFWDAPFHYVEKAKIINHGG
jgi:hypothetical protein